MSHRHSSGPADLLIFGGVMAVVVVGLIIGVAIDARRRKAVAERLLAQGFALDPKPAEAAKAAAFSRLATVDKLRAGPRGVRWVATGTVADRPVQLVEYRYSTGGGKSRRVHHRTVASVSCPDGWPEFSVSEDHWYTRELTELFGKKGPILENTAFNKRWKTKTGSDDFAVVFLTPQVQAWFMGLPSGASVVVRGGGISVVRNKRVDPEGVQAAVRAPVALLAMLPEELFDQQADEQGGAAPG
jgi:hypothetical protein